jgi:hypothetical protein
LRSYIESILTIKQFPNADPAKGKIVVSWDVGDSLIGWVFERQEKRREGIDSATMEKASGALRKSEC